jgi:hypothetical protein
MSFPKPQAVNSAFGVQSSNLIDSADAGLQSKIISCGQQSFHFTIPTITPTTAPTIPPVIAPGPTNVNPVTPLGIGVTKSVPTPRPIIPPTSVPIITLLTKVSKKQPKGSHLLFDSGKKDVKERKKNKSVI